MHVAECKRQCRISNAEYRMSKCRLCALAPEGRNANSQGRKPLVNASEKSGHRASGRMARRIAFDARDRKDTAMSNIELRISHVEVNAVQRKGQQ